MSADWEVAEEEANQMMRPQVDERGPDWHQQNGYYGRTLILSGLPATAESGWGHSITRQAISETDAYVQCNETIRLVPRDTDPRGRATARVASTSARIARQENSGCADTIKTRTQLDHERGIVGAATGEYELAYYIVARTLTREALDEFTEQLRELADTEGFSIDPVRHRHQIALGSCMPGEKDELEYRHVLSRDGM
jgi:hypothetical protein